MLEINNISKKFNDKKVLESVSFKLQPNNITAFLGKNGAGKSTLLNIIANQISKDTGDILFNGVSIFKKEHCSDFDFVLDISPLNDDITGMDFLKIKTLVYSVNPFPQEEAEKLITGFFEKREEIFIPIGKYSAGMKKKLELISCLLTNAAVLILDEPSNGLDISAVRKLINLLKQVKKDKIILFTSHDLYFIKELADSILVLKDAQLSFNGSKDDFLTKINGGNINENETIDSILPYF